MKKLLCIVLAGMLCLSCLTGCRAQNQNAAPGAAPAKTNAATEAPTEPATEEPAPGTTEPVQPIIQPIASPLGFTEFDSRLIAFLREQELDGENFAVSPLSFRAALALAASGAEGETLNQLLAVMGFRSVDEMNAWYGSVLAGVDQFADSLAMWGGEKGDSAYRVVNSAWKNEDLPGNFREDYVKAVAAQYRADAASAPAAGLADAVNAWVNEQTNGLIPKLLNDASNSAAVLVNALYLKACWLEPFAAAETADFAAADGSAVRKDYMQQTSRMPYYEDENCQLVSVPLQGGVWMVFVLGNAENLPQKLSRAEMERVHVTVPKFDLETSLANQELKRFLGSVGCTRMFSGEAEFDPMFTEPLFVDDIIQKSKVKIYEEGLEAAAATGIIMKNTAVLNPEQPKEFRADRAFSFYILQGEDAPELLFWGQIVR